MKSYDDKIVELALVIERESSWARIARRLTAERGIRSAYKADRAAAYLAFRALALVGV